MLAREIFLTMNHYFQTPSRILFLTKISVAEAQIEPLLVTRYVADIIYLVKFSFPSQCHGVTSLSLTYYIIA